MEMANETRQDEKSREQARIRPVVAAVGGRRPAGAVQWIREVAGGEGVGAHTLLLRLVKVDFLLGAPITLF